MGRQRGGAVQAQPLEEEGLEGLDPAAAFRGFRQAVGDCQALRETMISSCPGFPLPFDRLIDFQRAGRRTGDVAAVEVVDAVVAIAKDILAGRAILDRALQVRADRIERPRLAVDQDQQAGLPAEIEGRRPLAGFSGLLEFIHPIGRHHFQGAGTWSRPCGRKNMATG